MIDRKQYITLYLTFNYEDLCFIEEAISCFSSQTNTLKEHRDLIDTFKYAKIYREIIEKQKTN